MHEFEGVTPILGAGSCLVAKPTTVRGVEAEGKRVPWVCAYCTDRTVGIRLIKLEQDD